ncbi:MAG: hypothetical protein IJE59_00560 [Clostridia bacterium]|nr:hypothetical protein [Clostridia bacterium]
MKTKEIIICLVAIFALILTITTNVFAQDINALLNGSTSENTFTNIEEDNTTTLNNTTTNNVTNTTTNNITTNNVTTNVNNANTNKTTMPDTGVSYSSVVIIAICGISAIYAYKKIREYNV